jgi:hypothetical protein
MADSIIANNLPTNGVAFWGMYLNGHWPTYYHRIPPPNIRPIRISINAATFGDVYDVESGDLRPQDVPAALHVNPSATIYASLSGWQFVREICNAARIAIPPWWAAVPGYRGLYPGSVASQNRTIGGCDISDVADYWPGIDPRKEEDMPYVAVESGGTKQYLVDGNMKVYIPDEQPDSANLVARFGAPIQLSAAFLASIPNA